jgi:hypothetical protein
MYMSGSLPVKKRKRSRALPSAAPESSSLLSRHEIDAPAAVFAHPGRLIR